jgi:hypothetical protein
LEISELTEIICIKTARLDYYGDEEIVFTKGNIYKIKKFYNNYKGCTVIDDSGCDHDLTFNHEFVKTHFSLANSKNFELTNEEIKVINIFLQENPCAGGCIYPHMLNTNKDCGECSLVKMRNNILLKLGLEK